MSELKFSQERLLKVILGPVVSEKATGLADARSQFVFRVSTDATKAEIKSAVEMLFKKDVDNVQVINVKGKCRLTIRSFNKIGSKMEVIKGPFSSSFLQHQSRRTWAT